MGYIKAADLDELQPGQTKLVSNEGTEVVLCNVDGQYYAVDNFCPHMGAPLCEGELDGSDLWCPFHGASFDVKTGDVLTPPAYENLKCFPVRLTDEGIEIEI
tara:strand:- start:44034 stop:44339 length:306 start_codon:yes stop_codon:yes gene_type:complete